MMIDIDCVHPIFRALSERSRLEIVRELLDEPRHVGELVRRTGLGQSLVSHHLKVLREVGIVTSQRRGPFVYYALAEDGVRELMETAGGRRAAARRSRAKGNVKPGGAS